MPKHLHARGGLAALLIALLAGCAAPQAPGATPVASTPDAAAENRPDPAPAPATAAEDKDEALYPKQALTKELLFGFLLGDIAAQQGDRQLGADTWLELARRTRDPRAARRAVEVGFSAGKYDNALAAAQLWRTIEPGALLPRQTLLSLLARGGRLAEAEAELKSWLADRPKDAAGIFMQLHTLWTPQVDKQAALLLVRRLAADYPDLPEAALSIAVAANNAGQADAALAAADEAVRRKPDWEAGILYRAALTEARSPEAAVAYLKAASERLPKSRELRAALARELADLKRYDEALKAFAALGRDYPGETEYAVGEALSALQLRRYPQAETALTRALALGVGKPDTLRYYLGVAAEEQFKLTAARDHYAQVGDGELGVQAATRLARIEAKLGNRAAALAALQRLPGQSDADKVTRTQLEAQVWRELKDLKQARATLDAGLLAHPDNADLLYDRSLVFDQLGDVGAAETDLRRYLALNPDSALALNALGYTLANRTERFDEAEALLRQALAKEPDNPVILDSMGWLMLRRGKLAEGVQWLGRAFGALQDPEIAAHYGEALWRSGKQGEARKVWAQGARLDPDHEVLTETIQRLTGK